MTRITSTTYCGDPKCKGHRTVTNIAGRLVVTNDPANPIKVINDKEASA